MRKKQTGQLGNLIGGSVVIGAAMIYGGPFLTIIGIIAGGIYTAVIGLHMITPKAKRKNILKF